MVLVLGVGAEEATTPVGVLVGYGQAQNAGVEVAHAGQVADVETDMAQGRQLRHGGLLVQRRAVGPGLDQADTAGYTS